MHEQLIIKCNKLGNTVNRPKSAEIVQDVIGHTLSRLGSMYDSLKQINAMHGKSTQLHVALALKEVLSNNDITQMNT